MQPVEAVKTTEKLRAGVDERRSEWVSFPIGKLYLLPVVARHQRYCPTFNEDGTVEVGVEQGNTKLAAQVEGFLQLVATVQDRNIVISTTESIASFFGLVRSLILTNYDLAPDDLKSLLTVNNIELSQLFNSVLMHIVRQ